MVNADEDTADYMSLNSLASRVGPDTLHTDINLLNHMAGFQNNRGWVLPITVEAPLGQGGSNQWEVTPSASNDFKLYIYLREGQSKTWMYLKNRTQRLFP